MNGYQYLENDFFDLCKTRKIRAVSMLLYIYLRGLYCRFQSSEFFYKDKQIHDHLGFSHKTLQRARLFLQERGLIKFVPGVGKTLTTYQMLGTVLLPEGMDKTAVGYGHFKGNGMVKKTTPIYKSYERVKNRIGVFQGTTKDERIDLQSKGLYETNCKSI